MTEIFNWIDKLSWLELTAIILLVYLAVDAYRKHRGK
jgi:hypothetical protein